MWDHRDSVPQGCQSQLQDPERHLLLTPGLNLAFLDRRWATLSGVTWSGEQVTRAIPVCGTGAFTILKALAFRNRGENKDTYDLFYVWRGVGTENVAQMLALFLPNTHIENALNTHRPGLHQP